MLLAILHYAPSASLNAKRVRAKAEAGQRRDALAVMQNVNVPSRAIPAFTREPLVIRQNLETRMFVIRHGTHCGGLWLAGGLPHRPPRMLLLGPHQGTSNLYHIARRPRQHSSSLAVIFDCSHAPHKVKRPGHLRSCIGHGDILAQGSQNYICRATHEHPVVKTKCLLQPRHIHVRAISFL
jgi:hypothetical protein